MTKITLEAYKKAFREVKKEEEKRGFLVHLTIYIIVNTALAIINLIYSRETIWFIFPLVFWGLGLTIHYLGVRWSDKELERLEAIAEQRARSE